jgi:HSP20 family protein
MSLIKWSPFSPFFDREPYEAMEKWFNELQTSASSAPGGANLVPAIDMYETATAVVVEAPMPGVDPNKIEISIENGILSIKGTSERKTEVDEKNYYRQEVRHGSVFRQVALPARVLADKTEATFENGILKITVPKTGEEGLSVKVKIQKQK